MANALEELTVADLERMLDSRKQQLDDLLKQRDLLQKRLAEVEDQIRVLQGDRNGAAGRRGVRPHNERSLREYVVEILARSTAGLTLVELSEQVRKAGYQTASNNFRNVLYQCVYNTKDVFHDEHTGTYRMRSLVAKEMKDRGLAGR